MDKIPEIYNIQTSNFEEIETLNRLIMSKEIKLIIKPLPKQKPMQNSTKQKKMLTLFKLL
jgi:hypothetical protein